MIHSNQQLQESIKAEKTLFNEESKQESSQTDFQTQEKKNKVKTNKTNIILMLNQILVKEDFSSFI